ncbi:MAG: ABC transporter ATP-binding protein [Proteobacteria bacterium]|nr:ABC transporter ATP-binding protein [Pseudomonadota bacterium]
MSKESPQDSSIVATALPDARSSNEILAAEVRSGVSYPPRNKSPATPLVVVEAAAKRFIHEGHEIDVLRGIDLSIEAGEMLCVVGPSGAGKSTLLHLMGTLDLPTAGRILYEGQDVTRYSSSRLADFRNQSIGFVFQFHHLLPEFTALENVMMPGLIRGGQGRALEQHARDLLSDVGLDHRLSHRPGELSGGEQQRVALARAIVMRPKLVLADEPTGNLDSNTSKAIHGLFFRLNSRRGTTFLIVTHSADFARQMPRVVHMRDGRIERDQRRAPIDPPRGPEL